MAAAKEVISSTVNEQVSVSTASRTNTQEGGFFPWLEDEVHRDVSAKVIRRFPVLGAVGLIGSALTVVLSFLTLFFFKGHQVIVSGHLPKPAAWLSIILSLNGIFVHMAVSQGIAVTWWYRASREKATVAELHHVWATGSSVFSAISSYKTFNYVALATVFVATLPVNGILLQNSVSSTTNTRTSIKPISFAIADYLPYDFSGILDHDGLVESYHAGFQRNIPYLINSVNTQYASYNKNNTCKGYCQTELVTLGFKSTCKNYTIKVTLPLNTARNITANDVDIFSLNFSWSASTPYTIGMNTLVKTAESCTGGLLVNNCTLQLGTIRQKVGVQYDARTEISSWAAITEQSSLYHSSSIYNESPMVSYFTESPESNVTAFGGIVDALKSFYDGRIYLHQTANGTVLRRVGQYAQSLEAAILYDDNDRPIIRQKCNTFYDYFGRSLSGDLTGYMLDTLRTMFLYTSVYVADQDYTYRQTDNHTSEFLIRTEYAIIWRWWGASVLVTFSIILFILPTFYGFWTLARSTTLSPLETARAFQAPVLRDSPVHLDTKQLLKEVGGKNLHTDLGVERDNSNTSPTVEKKPDN